MKMDRNGHDISALGNDPVEGDPEANRNTKSINLCVQLSHKFTILHIYATYDIYIIYIYMYVMYNNMFI